MSGIAKMSIDKKVRVTGLDFQDAEGLVSVIERFGSITIDFWCCVRLLKTCADPRAGGFW